MISKRYATNVLLSLGANGAVAAAGGEVFKVESPRVDAKIAVGSGDCMLAGVTYGVLQGLSFEQSIICGVAAGAANTLTIGAGRFQRADFEEFRKQLDKSSGSK
jgi:fructose-1-phosphate kinase PfkB-like protein